jgi:hypothetical protein
LVANRLGNVGVGTNFYDGYETPFGIDGAAPADNPTVSYLSGIVFTGTYANGVALTNTASNPVTVASTGSISSMTGGIALYGESQAGQPDYLFPWNVTNLGRIAAVGSASTGVLLEGGGTVVNGQSGSSGGYISGGKQAISVAHAAGTVTNFATVSATATNGIGIYLHAGGRVTNHGAVRGAQTGVELAGGATLSNYGQINGTGTFGTYGVVLNGTAANFLTNSTTGYIGAAQGIGVFGTAGPATIVNSGTVKNGVLLKNGGNVTNGQSGATVGVIGDFFGIYISGAPGTVANYGAINFAGLHSGIKLSSGGAVRNAQNALISGALSGINGVSIYGGSGTVTNLGLILTAGTNGGAGVFLGNGGSVTNGASNATAAVIKDDAAGKDVGIEVDNAAGTIVNNGIVSGGYGIFFYGAGGAVTNAGTPASITGQYFGIFFRTGTTVAVGSVTNLGTIKGIGASQNPGPGSVGVRLQGGGAVTNGSSAITTATIQADESGSGGSIPRGFGVDMESLGTMVNYGTVKGTRIGVALFTGGRVTNGPGGATAALISGGYYGVFIGAGATSASPVTNFGTIAATGTTGIGVSFKNSANNALLNAGKISGAGGTAIAFGGGNDLLIDNAGAVFAGKVDGGGGSNTLELAPGTGTGQLVGLGTNFVNFATVSFDAGVPWTVEIPQGVVFAGVFSGFAKDDVIDLSGLVATSASDAGGVLTLDNGTTPVARLNVATAYSDNLFGVATDGSGGTLVTVAPAPPPSATTADMILRQGSTGDYEIYDLGNNQILAAALLGRVGPDWQFAGLGGFSDGDTTDMLLRDGTTGAFEVYDISNNNITAAAALGAVGLNWQLAGFGNFNGPGTTTDMMLRDSNTGTFELYDINNNMITGANVIGAVGLDWRVAGFGDFNGDGTTDMMLRNATSGSFEAYDIVGGQLVSATSVGAVGTDWQVAGFADFDGPGTTAGMMLRNTATGVFELYNISNNQITSASAIGAVGLDWQVAGFGPLDGVGSADMVLRNVNSGAFEVYDIANNQLTGAAPLGAVGLDWQLGGLAADSFTHSSIIFPQ